MSFARLPIDDVLPAFCQKLEKAANLVVVAPPGAGKTTRLPLALLDAPWRAGGKILVLEPRRLAARAAAERMASLLDQRLGETIGLKARLQSAGGPDTQIEVVTEGVFNRMILDDPSLEGVAAVMFDECHERALDADLGLALALDAQAALRPDLRLIAMSATLDGARVQKLMGGAEIVESQGRAFPVETVFLGRDPREKIEDAMFRAILRALAEQPGSILCFLPGQSEILRVARRLQENLQENLRRDDVDICPLFGAMERGAQDRAIRPAAEKRRKIVLATSIAETSITIDGVRVVIDSGLARAPRFEPDLGLTRLETIKISRAAADQRRGRAGRTAPGVCYRLWEEAATLSLPAFAPAEILAADLSGFLLDLAAWGARDPKDLQWLDAPPAPAVAEAQILLRELGAIDAENAITALGKAMRRLPLPPRLASMALRAEKFGAGRAACALALVLTERGLGGDTPDLAHRLDNLARDSSSRAKEAKKLAENWSRILREAARDVAFAAPTGPALELSPGALVALAYPDRIAKARGKSGDFLLANGRAASLEPEKPLAQAKILAVAEIAGRAGAARILAAAEFLESDFEALFGQAIQRRDETIYDPSAGALRRRESRRYRALTLGERNLPIEPGLENAQILARGVASYGLDRLNWSKAQRQTRDRVHFLRQIFARDGASRDENPWPDLSEAALAQNVEDWLAPYLLGVQKRDDIGPEHFDGALAALLPWELSRRLEAEAPTHFVTPAGSSIALDYDGAEGPALAARVQEFYGLASHPALAGGKAPLTLHLLSPAHRPIQITRDLPGFWRGSWADVRTEMKGRYPRHLWPEDPAAAAPTTRAKPRGA